MTAYYCANIVAFAQLVARVRFGGCSDSEEKLARATDEFNAMKHAAANFENAESAAKVATSSSAAARLEARAASDKVKRLVIQHEQATAEYEDAEQRKINQ